MCSNVRMWYQVVCILSHVLLVCLFVLSKFEFHCKSDVIACQPTVASLVMKLQVKGWLYQTLFVNDRRGCDPPNPPIMGLLTVQHFPHNPVLFSTHELLDRRNFSGSITGQCSSGLPIWRKFYGDQVGEMHCRSMWATAKHASWNSIFHPTLDVLSSTRRTFGSQKLFRINHWPGAAFDGLPIWRKFYGDQVGEMHCWSMWATAKHASWK